MLHVPGLYLSQSEHRGRGVFCWEDLKSKDLIEICPLIMIPEEDVQRIHESILHDYYFEYPEPKGSACIALGYGCLYNHSSHPNAEVAYDMEDQCIHIISTDAIRAGDEILIDYSAGEGKKMWFDEC
ncbi:MAG: SET domain-containing protein-lysine N-methyltransferase [Bacteroidia bacterium]|nr:SET domain-containing protein-lysine N-methyltransferase [Bacteroidia bacterium]